MKKLLVFSLALYFSACSQPSNDSPPDSSGGVCSTTTAEISECTTSTTYASPVVITGSAYFSKRTLKLNSGELVLGAPIVTPLPIRFAEVRVLDNSGNVVQCGTTDSTGALKGLNGANLEVGSAGTYTVQVLSRSNKTISFGSGKPDFQFYTSVKKDLCTNDLHIISKTTAAPGNILSADLTASATTGEVPGGAFNIYNDLLTTYEYLSQSTGTSDLTCLNPKLEIFWQAGFNPAQYIYTDEDPATVPNISFYLRGYNQLFVNGGKLGNVSFEDTDHFDDAVIIHEIGHRVEDACGKMDSPGGTHNGLFRIDPRLAWSEGWGNFFGAHIIRNNLSSINPEITGLLGGNGWLYYLDTKGYDDGPGSSARELIKLNLTNPGSSPEALGSGYYYDKVDASAYPGEGHFREVSIARSLFKTTNTCTNCSGGSYFPQMWQAFEKITSGIGMGKSLYPFRTSIRFYNRLFQVFTNASMPSAITAMDNILNSDEAQQRDGNSSYTSGGYKTWNPYAIKLVQTTVPCALKIQPRNENLTVTEGQPDQRYSNHFFWINMGSLSGVTQINLSATKIGGASSTDLDIDLILFQEGYRFVGETCTSSNNTGCVTYKKTLSSTEFIRSDRSSGTTKTIQSLNTLNTSTNYLLDIRAYTSGIAVSGTTEYSYTLTTGNPGEYLCPSSTF